VVWGGPGGFGNTPQEEKARIDQMVKLCKEYEFALFKFDAVCGPLLPENEDAFIQMMTECRKYSPDLILLNHRLGLKEAEKYATTFLWEGWETYIDVFMTNRTTAPHHRAGAISRGIPPNLQRLTEDHGVCISSCPDFWDDDLILQSFNRNLILAPELYGNPWLLADEEFPKLARIYNLHRKYRDIMVEGMMLPEIKYGPVAVSRGSKDTRLITLRNLTWEECSYSITLNEEIGLSKKGKIELRQYHPTEKVFGRYNYGQTVEVKVDPFRSCLIIASSKEIDEPGIIGAEYQVIKNVAGEAVEIDVLGLPGSVASITLADSKHFTKANINGTINTGLASGKTVKLSFPGDPIDVQPIEFLGDFSKLDMKDAPNWASLYEATVFSADNNALELRSIKRSGWSKIPEVRAAQDAFFKQKTFVDRGIWDKNLFDGDLSTAYWPSTKKYSVDQTVKRGCLRLDLGEVITLDQLILKTGDIFSLQPLLESEGNKVEVSTDLVHWESIIYLANTECHIPLNRELRYLRFKTFPSRLIEIEGFFNWQEGRPYPLASQQSFCTSIKIKSREIVDQVCQDRSGS